MTILYEIITARLIKYRTPSFTNEYILTRHEIKRILGQVFKINQRFQPIVMKELIKSGHIVPLNSNHYKIEPQKNL